MSDFALRIAAASLSAALLACWLVQAFGPPTDTSALGRWIFPFWLGVAIALIASMAFQHTVLAPSREHRQRGCIVISLVVLALVVRLVGVDHEVGERSYQDEGTYYHHATEINDGNPWRGSFVYGHVSYYAGAFGLWLAGLFPAAFSAIATTWTGTSESLAHSWFVLRFLVALLSAITVAPVFGIAWFITRTGRTIAGDQTRDKDSLPLLAGAIAGLLYIASPVMNAGSHLIISDWPSACLATFTLYCVARIAALPLNRPGRNWYALAGFFAGLAAATKYPAGTVAAAIGVIWLVRVLAALRSEDVKLPILQQVAPLLIATAVSMATFVAAMPTFLLDPHHAVFAPRGMLFGLRQYSGGGWIGVVRANNFAYYLDVLAKSLGWIALVSLASAPLLLDRPQRQRWLTVGSYAAIFLGLLLTMSLALERNVAPIIPLLSALAGISIAAVAQKLWTALPSPANRAAAALVCILALAWPAWFTFQQSVGLARSSTREVAADWLTTNLPQGTRLFRESYTPRLDQEHFFLRRARFAARVPIEEIEGDRYQYVLLAGAAFNRFFREPARTQPHHDVMARRYLEMFERYAEVNRWEPTPWRLGPTLILLQVIPRPEEPSVSTTPPSLSDL